MIKPKEEGPQKSPSPIEDDVAPAEHFQRVRKTLTATSLSGVSEQLAKQEIRVRKSFLIDSSSFSFATSNEPQAAQTQRKSAKGLLRSAMGALLATNSASSGMPSENLSSLQVGPSSSSAQVTINEEEEPPPSPLADGATSIALAALRRRTVLKALETDPVFLFKAGIDSNHTEG